MKKVFHFDAPREKYHCDAAVLWCFDNRFDLGFRKFLKRIGVMNFDPIKVAGGAKSLASPEHESDRQFLLDQICKSIKLHGTSRVILMLHSDCGAYGGLAGFRAMCKPKPPIIRPSCGAPPTTFAKPFPALRCKATLSTSKASGMPK